MFDEFWTVYPKKVDKAVAQKRFEAFPESQQRVIILDVMNRSSNHAQWQNKQFIPSPARYLLREMWNDEIILEVTNEQRQYENEDGSVLSRFWSLLIQFYGERWIREYGKKPPYAWKNQLNDLTIKEVTKMLRYLAQDDSKYLPDLPKMNMIRRIGRGFSTMPALPMPPADPKVAEKWLAEIKKQIGKSKCKKQKIERGK